MLDWLRYFPLTLRHSNEPVTPQGPYIPWLLKHKWQLRDSYFHLRCPMINPVIGDPGLGVKPQSPGWGDITRLSYNNGQRALQFTGGRWDHEHFFGRKWLFVGPWFMGIKSTMSLSASLIKPWKSEMFPESSFFPSTGF